MSSGSNFCVGFGAPQHIPAAHLANNRITVCHCIEQSLTANVTSLLLHLFQNAVFTLFYAQYGRLNMYKALK